jgi:hypothetical protein
VRRLQAKEEVAELPLSPTSNADTELMSDADKDLAEVMRRLSIRGHL